MTLRRVTPSPDDSAAPQTVPRAAQSPWVVFGLIALLCAIWSSTWLVLKWGLRDLPPFASSGLRFGFAGCVMAALAPWLGRREGGGRPTLRLVLWAGLGQFALSYGIVYWAEQRLSSGVVSVLWAVFPLMVAGLSVFTLPEERLVRRQWAGFVLAFVGVAVLFVTDLADAGAGAIPAGLVLLGSPLVSAFATVQIKKHGRGVSSVALNRNAMLLSGVVLGLGSLVFEAGREFAFTPRAWATIVYLALVGTCLAFGVYLWLMRWIPAYRLSLISYVTPALALLLGAWLDDERVTAWTVVGTGTIFAGVAVAAWRRRPGRKPR